MEGLEGGWKRGRGGKSLTLGQTHKGDISLLLMLKRLSTPSFLLLYFLFHFSSRWYSSQILILATRRKSSQHEPVNVFVSRLAGHRCQLASEEPGTLLDQFVRSPFSSIKKIFTMSSYFIKPLLCLISCHVITFESLPWPLSVTLLGSTCFTFHPHRAVALYVIVQLPLSVNGTERKEVQKDQLKSIQSLAVLPGNLKCKTKTIMSEHYLLI